MYEVHLQYGYTLKDIAEYIGIHYTTESRAIKKSRGNMKSDIVRPRNLPERGGKYGEPDHFQLFGIC